MTMSTINEEMKETADYAIKSAKSRYKKDLDFSDQSITILENILSKISWGFSGPVDDASEGGLAYNHALIWGSYLGEYMISKWGGKWIQRDSDRAISINDILFFPIKFVYQKITDHPEYNVEDYIDESRKIIYTSVINPQDALFEIANSERFKEQLASESSRMPFTIDRHSIFMVAGILGAMVIIAGVITGFLRLRSGGQPASGTIGQATRTSTHAQIVPTITASSTNTRIPTEKALPTSTRLPTETITPTYTPSATQTKSPSLTPSVTATLLFPKNTLPHWTTPTATRPPPTSTPQPPTVPPIVIQSCEVNPSTVTSSFNQKITFIVHFSAPGYQFTANNDGPFNGQGGCQGVDDNADSVAYCDGWSGELPDHTTVDVLITSPVGNCTTSYHSP
jgi:hypothetical protein